MPHWIMQAARTWILRTGWLVAIMFGALFVLGAEQESLIVSVEQGYLRGVQVESDPGIVAFRGIPYAGPASGEARWRPPQPAEHWEGIRDAAEIGPLCWQPDPGLSIPGLEYRFDEDCLNLNVWTPTTDSTAGLPVMVWIHGGSHDTGSGAAPWLSGRFMARKGVVYVTINYRLNVLGYLVHEALDSEAVSGTSGNYGVMDQIAALRWVKNNIGAFGGDPDNITVSGFSAGGVSVLYLLMSEQAQGLFQRAISHSGGYLRHLTHPDSPKVTSGLTAYEEGERFAEYHGVEGDASAALEALRAIPPEEIYGGGPWRGYPVIDGDIIPGTYGEQYSSGAVHSVDLMVGTSSDEGNGNWRFNRGNSPDEDYEDFLLRILDGAPGELIDQYRRSEHQSGPDAAARLETDLQTGSRHALLRLFAAARPDQAVYSYLFAHPMPHYAAQALGLEHDSRELGAYHGASVSFLNNSLEFNNNLPLEESDFRLADMVSQYMVNFAASGDPNGPELPEWPLFDPESEREFVIEMEPGMRPIQQRRRLEQLIRLIQGATPDQ